MNAKIRTIKKVTCVLGILFIMLGLLPMGVLSRVGSVFAEDGDVITEPESPPTEEPPAAPVEEPPAAPVEEPPAAPVEEPPAAANNELGVCGENGCEDLPAMGDDPVDGSFKVNPGTPGGASSFSGDLKIDDTTFDDVPAICGIQEDVIYVNTWTDFEVCSVTDMACINAIRTGQGKADLTSDEADLYGRKMDTLFAWAYLNNNYNSVVSAFRWLTGNIDGGNPFDSIDASTSISTWIGRPKSTGIQALAWYLGDYCHDDCPVYEACPQHCGYEGGDLPNGECGLHHCGEVVPPAKEACPTACGLPASQVHNGLCGFTQCAATEPCEDDDDPGTGTTGGGGGGGVAAAIIPVTAEELLVIPVTGVELGPDFLALKQAFLFGGMLLFGASLFLEGISRKTKI